MTVRRNHLRSIQAVLHAHSSWSYDAQWPLDKIARTFGRLGAQAVLMSEHDTGFDPDRFTAYRAACDQASTTRCHLIPGIEYSCPDNDIHILTWGLDQFLAEHRPVIEILQAVHRAGGVAILAHPARRQAWRKYDTTWTPYLAGIELWNRKSNGITWCPHALRLIRQTGLPPTVGCDFHHARQIYPLMNRFALTDDRDLESALMTALRAGQHVPTVFGRPILDSDGEPATPWHDRLERVRQTVLTQG